MNFSVLGAILAAFLWGATNPFLKQGGSGIEKIKKSNIILQFFAEIRHLFLNWRYLLPFVLNQSGSLVFYLTLASAELSLVVPVTNALTFLFTTITGKLLGEDLGGPDIVHICGRNITGPNLLPVLQSLVLYDAKVINRNFAKAVQLHH